MPLRWEDGTVDPEYPTDRAMNIEFMAERAILSSTTVTVKPSLNRYAAYTNSGRPVFGQLGQEITVDADLRDGNLRAEFGVADSGNIDTVTELLKIIMRVAPR